MSKFEVYIDESGLFIETSTNPMDRIEEHKQSRKFASQIAGIVFPRNQLDENAAEAIIRKSCKRTEVDFEHQFHATAIKEKSKYSRLVTEFCTQFDDKKIQPFRIANEEQVSFGDRTSNYTNIVAEALLRICHELSKQDHDSITLYVTAAKVVLEEDDKGEIHFMERNDYLARIHECFACAAMRKGYGSQVRNWKVVSLKIGSARENKLLQLCDVVSNASHDNFVKCDSVAKSRLEATLGGFNWTLSNDAFFDEVNEHVAQDSFGLAFIAMAQRAVDLGTSGLNSSFDERLNQMARRFSQLPGGARLPQLKILVNWLQQGIESRSDLGFSVLATKWSRDQLGKCLMQNADGHEQISTWLEFATTSLLITTYNHLGKTIETASESARLDELIPRLAGRWEYSSDIMEALIAQAVYLNDCFEHQIAVEKMNLVAGFFGTLSGFFKDAFADVFPEQIESDLWGKALGTKVQSETFLALQHKIKVEQLRRTSDAAIQQFSLLDDKHRQYQYRSEIESMDSQWEEARRFLAMSLGLEDNSHDAIADAIARIENDATQGFAFLHWTRIGGGAAVKSARNELKDFSDAFKSHRFDNHSWIQGQVTAYPVHGILRRVAVIKAANGDQPGSVRTLNRLRSITIDSADQNSVFTAIAIAAFVQVAAFLFKPETGSNRELLDQKNGQKPGARQIIEKLVKRTEGRQPRLAALFSDWESVIGAVLEGDAAPSTLAELGQQVGY